MDPQDIVEKEHKFYIGALIGFGAACLVVFLLLCYFWLFLKDYEACLPSHIVETLMQNYSGGDLYYYEDSTPGEDARVYRIVNGNRRVSTITLVPDGKKTFFGHQNYKVGAVEDEAPAEPMQLTEGMSVWETLQAEQAEAATSGEEEEEISLPVTEEEEKAVTEAAEAFMKAYSPFATFKNTGNYRSAVLALVEKDTELYEKLGSYVNSWGQNVSSYDFSDFVTEEIRKTSDTTYECNASCKFNIKNADWGVSRPYDLSYHLVFSNSSGSYLVKEMEME